MISPLLLPLRWYARPSLMLAGLLAATIGVAALKPGTELAPAALIVAQAEGPDPEASAAAARDLLHRRLDVASERRLSDEEVAALLRREGIDLPSGALPLPPIIEVRVATGTDPAPVSATLGRIRGIDVDVARQQAPRRRDPVAGLLIAAAAAIVIAAVLRDMRTWADPGRLLHQLGMHPLAVAGRMCLAVGASLLVGAGTGALVALAVLRIGAAP